VLGLSPLRLLIIGVVGLILVGPDKLPGLARQAGTAWKTLRSLQERVEDEIRQTVPDLPRTSDIARYARSPVSLLNKLAEHTAAEDESPSTGDAEDGEQTAKSATEVGFSPPDDVPSVADPDRPSVVWGDPSLN
jgi:sec-independent protein translocase protein TatB